MGEYQNRAVALVTASAGENFSFDREQRSQACLVAAIELFYVLGGSAEGLATAAATAAARPAPAIDTAIGELMKEIAAIGAMKDLDIMQAAYNTLDRQMRAIKVDRARRSLYDRF
ncbi:Hypothetical protein RG1141_CH04430 [Neorhizobium galegae bv. officinalis bv. officinalis str. HAMBI 1141]|uniref:Uncharacterized protein n=1 Tax=Neorhizobium galegae bv. officinalis bv. officinalis str. HAMBI 1141 TaxID=1028801 RepID=A0A068T417_NEOGA|nr:MULTISPECIES: hypothetical protein [Neorhizobium]MCJ9752396.1 hypothetical protein [Neorhizobium sp. BETTINA12A]CDN52804.1 Hypothetical protein RG1141_CH04430 [Neorhizobium galegae bv. officinalis bv. officinalis str. HAMBI 1141]